MGTDSKGADAVERMRQWLACPTAVRCEVETLVGGEGGGGDDVWGLAAVSPRRTPASSCIGKTGGPAGEGSPGTRPARTTSR